jgi:exonuclease III
MLNFYTVNVQGMLGSDRKVSLLRFVARFRPVVLAVQETNLDTCATKLIIPGYRAFYNAATTRFSGTVVFVSNDASGSANLNLINARLQRVSFSLRNESFCVFNIHMPHNDAEALALVGALRESLADSRSSHKILCGDWNYVDNCLLDRVGSSTDRPRIRRAMAELISRFNLFDSFRVLHPTEVVTTHTGVQAHPREQALATHHNVQYGLQGNRCNFEESHFSRVKRLDRRLSNLQREGAVYF